MLGQHAKADQAEFDFARVPGGLRVGGGTRLGPGKRIELLWLGKVWGRKSHPGYRARSTKRAAPFKAAWGVFKSTPAFSIDLERWGKGLLSCFSDVTLKYVEIG